MSSIPDWLRDKMKTYQTYNLNDLKFHNSLCLANKTNSQLQTGGSLFNQPRDIHSFRTIIKNTLLKEFESSSHDDYFN